MNTWLNRNGHFDGTIEVVADEGILIHLDTLLEIFVIYR